MTRTGTKARIVAAQLDGTGIGEEDVRGDPAAGVKESIKIHDRTQRIEHRQRTTT